MKTSHNEVDAAGGSEYGHKEHFSIDRAGVCDSDDHRANKKAHLAAGCLPDFGELAQDLDFSDFLLEEGIFGASNISEASFDTALNNIKKSKRRGLTQRQASVSFSEDDFDDPAQRKAFILIRHYKNEIFKANATPQEIIEAATFIFGRSDAGDLNFDICCEVLEARRDVLRMRFHYEFFLKWMVFPVEMPFLIDPLPKAVENEILLHVSEDARTLAAEAWIQPGISTEDLYQKAHSAFSNKTPLDKYRTEMKRWLEAMEDRYIMSRMHDNWYLTGRNPLLERIASSRLASSGTGVNVSWSKLW